MQTSCYDLRNSAQAVVDHAQKIAKRVSLKDPFSTSFLFSLSPSHVESYPSPSLVTLHIPYTPDSTLPPPRT